MTMMVLLVKALPSPMVHPFDLAREAESAAAMWRDWDKRQECHPTGGLIQPSSVDEIVAIVRSAAATGRQVKTVGSGHSFSQITLTDDGREGGSVLLNLDKLESVLELPEPPRSSSPISPTASSVATVHVEAGIRVHDLNTALLAAGWALENTGAIAQQSVAGATQTGTHGTGSELGSMSSQLTELTLVLANATVVTCSATTFPELYGAARVGLGALGVLVHARVRVVPMFKLKRVAIPYDLDQLVEDLPRLNEQYERLQWYYTPYTTNATLLLRIPAPLDAPIIPCWPGDVERSQQSGANVTCLDWSFKALCHEADDAVLYTEMEYFVAKEHAPSLVADFRAFQASVQNESQCAITGPHSNASRTSGCSLFTGLRYGRRDEVSWMSQMFGRDIAVLSNIVLGSTQVAGPPAEFVMYGKNLERIAAKYGGRPHWGKMHWATASDLRPQYPMFDMFKAMREELDPHGMFLNNYLRRVLGIEDD